MAFDKNQLLGPTIPDPIAVSYLQLCQISYAIPTLIPGLVPAVNPLNGGTWKCIWGPAQDVNDANLVYIAAYIDGATGLPVLAAVVIRGTDADISNTWGILEQAFEDLLVPFQSPVPWLLNSPALLADGTLDALYVIQNLLDPATQTTIAQFLTSYLTAPANQRPVLVVTGHSLGGCLTTVVAPWLQETLSAVNVSNPIVPVTFAGPTAGNADFATYFSNAFGYAPRYFNTLDVVPRAWADLMSLDSIYSPCNLTIPLLVAGGIVGFQALMNQFGATYGQPQTNMAPIPGTCLNSTPPPDWYQEGLYQHHTTTYLTLLGGTAIITDAQRLVPLLPRRNPRRPGAPLVPIPQLRI
jgi:triacylglycerol lipase